MFTLVWMCFRFLCSTLCVVATELCQRHSCNDPSNDTFIGSQELVRNLHHSRQSPCLCLPAFCLHSLESFLRSLFALSRTGLCKHHHLPPTTDMALKIIQKKFSRPAQLQSFVFLRLPAELRNTIYQHVFQDSNKTTISVVRTRKSFVDRQLASLRKPTSSRTGLALLQTCSQIQKEALKYFYQDAHFNLFLRDGSRCSFSPHRMGEQTKLFLTVLRPKLRFVRNLDVGTDDLTAWFDGASRNAGTQRVEPYSLIQPFWHKKALRRCPRDNHVLLVTLLKLLASDMWRIRTITIHDNEEDQYACSNVFLREIGHLFPFLDEIVVLRTQPARSRKHYKLPYRGIHRYDNDMDNIMAAHYL